MKTNKNLSEDNLRKLFAGIPFEEPSPDFMENLLSRIEKEVILQGNRKRRWIVAGQIAAGIFGIFILPALVIYLCTLFLPGFSFTFPEIHLKFDSNLLVIGSSILMLLILDTFFRIHKANRTKN